MTNQDVQNFFARIFDKNSGLKCTEIRGQKYADKAHVIEVVEHDLDYSYDDALDLCDRAERLGYMEEGVFVKQIGWRDKWIKGIAGTYKHKK